MLQSRLKMFSKCNVLSRFCAFVLVLLSVLGLGCLSLLSPHIKTRRRILEFRKSGLTKTGRNWVQFNATVAETEQLFNTEYHYYEHNVEGGYRIACDEYHLPESVRDHVDFAVSCILVIN
jgi:hypothetical protein